MNLCQQFQCFALLLSLSTTPAITVQLSNDESMIELNYMLDENTLHWITARAFEKKKSESSGFHTITSSNGSQVDYWYLSEDLQYNSHTGTHLDAPCHFYQFGWCVHQIPIEHLMDVKLVVMDVSSQVRKNSDYQVSVEDLQSFEQASGQLELGSILFLQTGWSSKWPIKEDYFGIRNGNESELHFPGLSAELAEYIAREDKVVGVGIEGPSIDPGLSHLKHAHRVLGSKNMYIIENLPKLDNIKLKDSRVTIAPLRIIAASGSPVRIFVRLTDPCLSNDAASVSFQSASFSCHLIMTLIASFFFFLRHSN